MQKDEILDMQVRIFRKFLARHHTTSKAALEIFDRFDILDFITECYAVLKTGERAEIEKLMDLDSLVDTYLVEEFGKNFDTGHDSYYLYKEKGGWFFEFRLPASISGGEVRLRSCKQEITYEPLLGDYLFVLPTEGDFMGYDTSVSRISTI